MHEDRYPPIGDYGFLSDCHNWALVSRSGAVDWLCFERAGGHTVFARILDHDRGGTCELRPDVPSDVPVEVSRRYLEDTNVLATRFETDEAVFVLTDALLVDERGDHPGEVRPHGRLVRRIRCESGGGRVRLRFDARFDYGLTGAHVRVREAHTATAIGGADAVVVHSEIDLEQDDWETCRGDAEMTAGDERWVTLSYQRAHELEDPLEVRAPDRSELSEALDTTVGFWRDWVSRCGYQGPYREAVVRSALVLKGLVDARTGAIIAAPTTSLPEEVGGVRNWDYRFTWIRDAAWHLNALFGLGYTHEANAFMRWLSRTTAGTAADLQVMYGNTGRRMMPETDIHELEGYRGSSPVRIGNGAASQFQLDIYGELVSAVWHHHQHGGELTPELRHLLPQILDVVEERWEEPDRGIWEVRGAPQHFVSSKLYAWVAADRLYRLSTDGALDLDEERARNLRDRIREHIERYGVDPEAGAVLRVFGQPGVDASSLLFVLEGFLDPADERVSATLGRIHEDLTDESGTLVHRYVGDDGLSGRQSAFWWCSFWLVSVHVERGELDRARELFERLLDLRSDLGLLSEEIDDDTHDLLGNFPQAISHVGLIDAALRIAEAEHGEDATERVMAS